MAAHSPIALPAVGILGKLKGAATLAKQVYDEGATQAANAQLAAQPLQGPAGRHVAGVGKAPTPPPRIEDPTEWDRVMRAELAVRDAAREPYLAPTRSPLRISRFVTRGGTEAQEVVAHLGACGLAARPELVYGVYRVPDRIRPSAGREKGRVVEWDVVHAATSALPPAPPPADVFFDARATWVERRIGEPRPLDEDLALTYLVAAGLGPERTLGIARHTTIDPWDSSESQHALTATVEGVHVFHPAPAAAPAAPLPVGPGPPEGIQIALLNWDAIALVVHPVRQQRPYLPSSFPYLPLTPQELLRAYLGIVGNAPHDCYCAQITYDRQLDLLHRSSTSSHVRKTTGGDELPCADGKPRVRMHGGAHVVVAYRDTPAYAEGHGRWSAYEGDVLQADLARETDPRRPVPAREYGKSKLERGATRFADAVSYFDTDAGHEPGPPPPRYCWPPVGV
jgi:hypothetical protein